jgi:hypothetical protein
MLMKKRIYKTLLLTVLLPINTSFAAGVVPHAEKPFGHTFGGTSSHAPSHGHEGDYEGDYGDMFGWGSEGNVSSSIAVESVDSVEYLVKSEKDTAKISEAAYEHLSAGKWEDAIKLYKAAKDKGDTSTYILSWYGVALLNSKKKEHLEEGAGYLVETASKRDIQSIRFLSALDESIIKNIEAGNKIKAVEITVTVASQSTKTLTLD